MIYWGYFMLNLLLMLFLLIMMLIGVAFLTLFERKVLGYIQIRKGPNKVGFLGLLQPFSDVIKLLNKSFFLIDKLNYYFYFFSSIMILSLSMMMWGTYIFSFNLYSMKFSILYLLMILSLSVYPIMMGGWSSNSNYSMLGCLRSIAQSVSFEVSMFLILFIIILLIESYSFVDLNKFQYFWMMLFLFPIYFMCMLSMLIELNRTPFDLIEGESELVSGFNTEYFGGCFALIFMSEYLSIIYMSFFMVIMFMLSNLNSLMFIFLWMFHIFFIVWIRGVLPRIRYDTLMYLCWKNFLSVVLIYIYMLYMFKMFLLYFI